MTLTRLLVFEKVKVVGYIFNAAMAKLKPGQKHRRVITRNDN